MSYQITEAAASAKNIRPEDAELVRKLVAIWREKLPGNEKRDRYYLSHVRTKDLGIAIAPEMRNKIKARIDWPAKAVDYLAARSQFDGFTTSDDTRTQDLMSIVQTNHLKLLYRKAVTSELKHCCVALTVTADENGEPVISSYPMTACALIWDDALKEVKAGLVVAESKKPTGSNVREPTMYKLFTRDALVVISKTNNGWVADYAAHSMGRPLIEPMAYRPTLERPFGRSRITRTVMSLTDDAQREKERSEIAAEFAAYPQKYLLGTDSQLIPKESRYAAYIGAIMEVTKGEDGTIPSFGQLSQLSMQPHIDYMRSLAAQFSGATNVPLSALGVVSDNPSSAEAIYAAKEDLVIDAQALNADNGRALVNIAMMALAINDNSNFSTIQNSGIAIEARFRNPAMPSVVSQSDAMVKQISVLPWLAESDVALEELGYNEEQIQRLHTDRTRWKGMQLANSVIANRSQEQQPQQAEPQQEPDEPQEPQDNQDSEQNGE